MWRICAENLESDTTENYSSCLPVANVAKKYPKLNFIVSHFDYTNLTDCAKLVLTHRNIYTDISGTYENLHNEDYNDLMNDFVFQFKDIFKCCNKRKLSKKVMFGTDFYGV